MKLAIAEVKLKAKLLLKQCKTNAQSLKTSRTNVIEPEALQLKHCLVFISQKLGLKNWQQAQALLSGSSPTQNNLNFGTMWYDTRCTALTNHWFSNYQEAKDFHASNQHMYLVPFNTQCAVVEKEYLLLLGFKENEFNDLKRISHDLISGYGSASWDHLARQRIHHQIKIENYLKGDTV